MSPLSASICSRRGAICPWPSYVTPAQFDAYRDYGLSIGFKMVFSGPLVRSSYMADLVNEEASARHCLTFRSRCCRRCCWF